MTSIALEEDRALLPLAAISASRLHNRQHGADDQDVWLELWRRPATDFLNQAWKRATEVHKCDLLVGIRLGREGEDAGDELRNGMKGPGSGGSGRRT